MNKRKTTLASGYTNFTIPSDNNTIAELTYDGTINADKFYNDFIKTRKPVKLTNYFPPLSKDKSEGSINLNDFSPDNIVDTLNYDSDLQIEKKFQHGFGSGQKRVKMTLESLMQLFAKGHDEYYLTTQYDFDDPDKQENDKDMDSDEEEEIDIQAEEDDDEDENEDSDEVAGAIENVDEEEEDDEEEDDEGEDGGFGNFSDTSSIDMNNLHDDFVESDEEEDPIVDEETSLTQSEAFQRVKELLQPPLTNLVDDKLPIVPELFSKLVPQQINLWMGATKSIDKSDFVLDPKDTKTLGLGKYVPGVNSGSSSGLHHDHADNLYILASGSKRFTLFLPADALKMYTVGTIYKIFNSGIIDYEINQQAPNWKHIRDDGAIIEEIIHWKLDQMEDDSEKAELLKQLEAEINERKKMNITSDTKLDPPNFSTIPPALLHIEEFEDKNLRQQLVAFADTHFPGFLGLRRYTVWLNPGEMLYLPAGWFHEVTSFGAVNKADPDLTLNKVHIALNYWFVPPNADLSPGGQLCYSDGYWHKDWEMTRKSLQFVKSITN
jgi:hypothetical protein